MTEHAHESLELHVPQSEEIERVWVTYWAPMFREGGLEQIKAELYEYWWLVNEARQVYRHVTGGLCDDLTASAEGIIAEADKRVEDLIERARVRK